MLKARTEDDRVYPDDAPGLEELWTSLEPSPLERVRALPAANDTTIALGDKPIASIITADVDVIREHHRAEYRKTQEAVERWDAFCRAVAELPPAEQEKAKATAPPMPPRPGRAGAKHGEVGINRLLARLRHVFSWAIKKGDRDDTPFRRHGQTAIELENLSRKQERGASNRAKKSGSCTMRSRACGR